MELTNAVLMVSALLPAIRRAKRSLQVRIPWIVAPKGKRLLVLALKKSALRSVAVNQTAWNAMEKVAVEVSA